MGNRIEKLIYTIGHLRGLYQRALKGADASLGDPTAWNTGRFYGVGSLALTQKPGNSDDLAKWFTSWSYICAVTNANARAAIATNLFVGSATKGKAWETITTRSIDKARRKYLESRNDLRRFIIKAADVEEVTEHRYLDLMARPNPFLSESDLKYLTSIFMDLTGRAYWYIGVRDKLGIPAQIWTIPAQFITPIPGKSLSEFIKGYRYERGRVRQDLPIEDVVEFKVPSPLNEYTGMSCLQGVADAVYVNAKMYEFEEALFVNKARVGGVLETDTKVTPAQADRLREDFKQKYEGAAQAGRTVILPTGMKFSKDSMTPEELSYIEGKRLTAEELCMGFGIPKGLFDPSATRANVEGAQLTHAMYAVAPWLRRYDDTLNGDFIPIYDDSGKLFVVSDNPIPEDKAFLLQKRTADLSSGASTINEARAEDGKEPVAGGDEPLVSFSLAPLSQVVAEPEPEPAPIIVPGKPADEDEDDEDSSDNLDTGETGKAAMLDELQALVEQKIKEKLEGRV